jgi:Cdc6-like AAA superfamily ATPase
MVGALPPPSLPAATPQVADAAASEAAGEAAWERQELAETLAALSAAGADVSALWSQCWRQYCRQQELFPSDGLEDLDAARLEPRAVALRAPAAFTQHAAAHPFAVLAAAAASASAAGGSSSGGPRRPLLPPPLQALVARHHRRRAAASELASEPAPVVFLARTFLDRAANMLRPLPWALLEPTALQPSPSEEARLPGAAAAEATGAATWGGRGPVAPAPSAADPVPASVLRGFEAARRCLDLARPPDTLPCREAEAARLRSFFEEGIRQGGLGGAVYISGMPGTGKTATVRAVLQALRAEALAAAERAARDGMRAAAKQAATKRAKGLGQAEMEQTESVAANGKKNPARRIEATFAYEFDHGDDDEDEGVDVYGRVDRHAAAPDAPVPVFDVVEINAFSLRSAHELYSRILEGVTGEQLPPKRAAGRLEQLFSADGTDCFADEHGPDAVGPGPAASLQSAGATAAGGAIKTRGFAGTRRTRSRRCTVLVVDEIDCLVTQKQTVLYNLFDWPTRPDVQLIVVGIANTMDLPERLLPKVASRLGMERIVFGSYKKEQITLIIADRLKCLPAGMTVFDEDALRLCGAKVASLFGDVRRALQICRKATEVAEGRLRNYYVQLQEKSKECGTSVTQLEVERESLALGTGVAAAAAGAHRSMRHRNTISATSVTIQDINAAAAHLGGRLTQPILWSCTPIQRLLLMGVVILTRRSGISMASLEDVYAEISLILNTCGHRQCAPPAEYWTSEQALEEDPSTASATFASSWMNSLYDPASPPSLSMLTSAASMLERFHILNIFESPVLRWPFLALAIEPGDVAQAFAQDVIGSRVLEALR